MRWLRRWCHSDADPETSRKALEDAQAEQERAEANTPYVEWLAEKMLSHSEDNHFSDLVFRAMRRKHP